MENQMTNEKNNADYAIEIYNLSKTYKGKEKDKKILALNNINLKVKKGEVFGLLGPNGAGKTTMVSILTSLIQPTEGYASILNNNILKSAWYIKKNVGLMLGRGMIYNRITGYKNLKFWAKLYDVKDYKKRINELAELFELKEWLNEYVEYYSSGMKTKLAFMRVLLPNPKIIFLDEPMIGLDPNIVNKISEILQNMNKTIFLTSHQMNIVEKLCDRIAFLKKGEIITVADKDEFKKAMTREIAIKVKVKNDSQKLFAILKEKDFINNTNHNKDIVIFSLKNPEFYSKLFKILSDFEITSYQQFEPNLEDIFLELSLN